MSRTREVHKIARLVNASCLLVFLIALITTCTAAQTGNGPKGKQYAEAEAQLKEAVRLHPRSTQAGILLGQFYEHRGDLPAAEKVLTDLLRVSPSSSEVRELLAFVLAKEHKYVEADSVLRPVKLPAETGARISHLRLIASIQSGLGHPREAALAIENAVQLAPEDSTLRLAAAAAEAEAGAWNECIRYVAPLYRAHPAADTGLLLLRAQLGAKQDFGATLQSLEVLGNSEEEKIAIRLRSAHVLSEFGEHAQAVHVLEHVLNTAGRQQDLLLDLAAEQYRAKQLDAALSTLSQVRQLGPNAEAEDLAGDIAEAKGDYLTAVHSYQNAVELAPGVEKYRLSLGAELIRHHAYEPAILVFRQAASLFPDSTRVFLGLGMAQFFQEQYDESVTSLLRADELSNGSADAMECLGRTQLRRPDGPLPVVVDRICRRSDTKKDDAMAGVWCSTLRFRQAFLADDHRSDQEILRQLRAANQLAPDSTLAVCALGRALAWTSDWAGARGWLERCVRLQPGSIEDHYRLSRVYRELGLTDLARGEAEETKKANAVQDKRENFGGEFIYQIIPPSADSTPDSSPVRHEPGAPGSANENLRR